MRFLQRHLHVIRKRAWEHKKALFHMNRAIKEMELVFARDKISYHEYQEIEKVIEITQTTGKHKLNLLTKPMIDQILRKIPEKKRKKMNYVHLGGIQIK